MVVRCLYRDGSLHRDHGRKQERHRDLQPGDRARCANQCDGNAGGWAGDAYVRPSRQRWRLANNFLRRKLRGQRAGDTLRIGRRLTADGDVAGQRRAIQLYRRCFQFRGINICGTGVGHATHHTRRANRCWRDARQHAGDGDVRATFDHWRQRDHRLHRHLRHTQQYRHHFTHHSYGSDQRHHGELRGDGHQCGWYRCRFIECRRHAAHRAFRAKQPRRHRI